MPWAVWFRRDSSFLGDLDLFSQPTWSALTFLRIFTSIPFMLDVEQIYGGKKVTFILPNVALTVLLLVPPFVLDTGGRCPCTH